MARNELNVDVNVRLSVPDEVAERIMTLLAMYLDDHPEKVLLMECDEHGKHRGKVEDLNTSAREDNGNDLFPEWDVIPVQDIPSYTELIYMEESAGACYGARYQYTDEKTDTMVFKTVKADWKDGVTQYRRIADYGRTWRCWDKPTTTEVRKAVKWK